MFFKDQRKDAARHLMAAFNAHDHLALANCLTANCIFIDSAGGRIEGRSGCVEATRLFMTLEPEFHIEVDSYSVVGDEVLMQGETTARDPLIAKDRYWRGSTNLAMNWPAGSPNSRPIAMANRGSSPGYWAKAPTICRKRRL